MEERRKNLQEDRMKWYMLGVSSIIFALSAVTKLFKPDTEINTLSNVFLAVCGLVLGASVANYFKKKDIS